MITRVRIESLKKALSVPEYFRLTNHVVKRVGKDYATLCPFHKEKTPSCFLYPDHYHCYACGEHGDVIDAHMKFRHFDFTTALEDLGRMAGITQNLTIRNPGRVLRVNIIRREKD